MARRKPPETPEIDSLRAKRREYANRYRASHPDYAARDRERSAADARAKMLAQRGLTDAGFQRLLASQGGCCAICRTPFTVLSGGGRSRAGKPHVDHDHATGKVRGLLCVSCNSVLGHAKDNQSILGDAQRYLKEHGTGSFRRGWAGTVTGKVWGETTTFISTPVFEMHRIMVLPNAKCSLHMHRAKANVFIVLSGILYIDVHKNDYELVDVTELRDGDVHTVKPGEYHQFRTGDVGAQALEVYFPASLSEDIVRKDVGGLVGKAA